MYVCHFLLFKHRTSLAWFVCRALGRFSVRSCSGHLEHLEQVAGRTTPPEPPGCGWQPVPPGWNHWTRNRNECRAGTKDLSVSKHQLFEAVKTCFWRHVVTIGDQKVLYSSKVELWSLWQCNLSHYCPFLQTCGEDQASLPLGSVLQHVNC